MRGAHHALSLAACSARPAAGAPCRRPAAFRSRPTSARRSTRSRRRPCRRRPSTVTNRFADDPRAAALGQKLFFDARFSGRAARRRRRRRAERARRRAAETGKVACAGCHVAASGFLDDRTLGKQISLAAGWAGGARRRCSTSGRPRSSCGTGGTTRSTTSLRAHRIARRDEQLAPLRGRAGPSCSTARSTRRSSARCRRSTTPARFPALSAERTGVSAGHGRNPQPTCNGTEHGVPGRRRRARRARARGPDAVTRVVVNLGKALGAYERLLSCGPGRFDSWMAWARRTRSRSPSSAARGSSWRGGSACRAHAGPFLSDQKFPQRRPHAHARRRRLHRFRTIRSRRPGSRPPSPIPLNVRGAFSDGDDGRLPTACRVDDGGGVFARPPCAAPRAARRSCTRDSSRRWARSWRFFARGGDPFGLSRHQRARHARARRAGPAGPRRVPGHARRSGPAPALLKGP